MEPLPAVFDMLQYFQTILPSVEAFALLNKIRYILLVVALLEACDGINNGRHFGRHFLFIQVKTSINDHFLFLTCKIIHK